MDDQDWFRHFNLKDKPKPETPSVVEDEALLEMVEQQPDTSIHRSLTE